MVTAFNPLYIPGLWTPRIRQPDRTLADPVLFTELELIERYNQPDTLLLTGDIEDLRAALDPGSGIYLIDDRGRPRFSGYADSIERRGDQTAAVTYKGDLTVLWERICWPQPTSAWTAQNVDAYDTETASSETRILGYINRNAGAAAFTDGTVNRPVAGLRLPGDFNRGASATTTARFDNLGQLVADLAESADLRVRIMYAPEGGSGFFDVLVDDAPDLTGWAGFGDVEGGTLGLLDQSWRYAIGPGVSLVLSAAGGEGTARVLNYLQDTERRDLWGRHIEFFVDQRDNEGDATEITEGMTTAMTDNAPRSEIGAPIVAGDIDFGSDEPGAIPVGAKVFAILDGEFIIERLRQLTTTVSLGRDETIRVEPVIGSTEAGLNRDQKLLADALRRLRTLEAI